MITKTLADTDIFIHSDSIQGLFLLLYFFIRHYYAFLWYVHLDADVGLGVSEFVLRFMAWLCLKDNALAGTQMCIVTGPRIELAIALIERMKGLFRNVNNFLRFDTKETVIELNGVKIEAFPSHHLDIYANSQFPKIGNTCILLTSVFIFIRKKVNIL